MSTPPFELFARQTADRPYFLGFHLAAFAAREQLSDGALAARLGCDLATLAHVRLCRAPRRDSARAFREDVTAVADQFGLSADALADAAKAVPVVPARGASAPEGTGAVLAARDRDDAP